jgi:hypothetical protein
VLALGLETDELWQQQIVFPHETLKSLVIGFWQPIRNKNFIHNGASAAVAVAGSLCDQGSDA